MATIDRNTVIRTARALLSEHGENPEYDRAIAELVRDLTGLPGDQDEIEALIRNRRVYRVMIGNKLITEIDATDDSTILHVEVEGDDGPLIGLDFREHGVQAGWWPEPPGAAGDREWVHIGFLVYHPDHQA